MVLKALGVVVMLSAVARGDNDEINVTVPSDYVAPSIEELANEFWSLTFTFETRCGSVPLPRVDNPSALCPWVHDRNNPESVC